MTIKIGDYFYSKKFIGYVESEVSENMYGVTFRSRDGKETNYNIVSPLVLEAMVNQKEWFEGEDPFVTICSCGACSCGACTCILGGGQCFCRTK